jgi:hypothetical protein
MISFEGREDDATQYTITDNLIKVARYVVPARRHIIAQVDKDRDLGCNTNNMSVLLATANIQIVPKKEVKPTFRTPCRYCWNYVSCNYIQNYLKLFNIRNTSL